MAKAQPILGILALIVGFGCLMVLMSLLSSGKASDFAKFFFTRSEEDVVAPDPTPDLEAIGPIPTPQVVLEGVPTTTGPTPTPTPDLTPIPGLTPVDVDNPLPSPHSTTRPLDAIPGPLPSPLGSAPRPGTGAVPPAPPVVEPPPPPRDKRDGPAEPMPGPQEFFSLGDRVRWVGRGGWIHEGEVKAYRVSESTGQWLYDVLRTDGTIWPDLEETRIGRVVPGITGPYQPRVEGLLVRLVNRDGSAVAGIVEATEPDPATGSWRYRVRLANGELFVTEPTVRILLSDVIAVGYPTPVPQAPTALPTPEPPTEEPSTESLRR
jgi:hypothetical protein